MKFISTRGKSQVDCAATAIAKGLADDGGLFVPQTFPSVSMEDITKMIEMDYAERACFVLHKYLEEYDYEGNDRVVDNHIKKLRKAIGSSGKHIKTVVAKGYKMTEKI